MIVPDNSGAVELGGGFSRKGVEPLPSMAERIRSIVAGRAAELAGTLADPFNGLDILGIDVTWGHAHMTHGLVEGFNVSVDARGLLLGQANNVFAQMMLGPGLPTQQEADTMLQALAQTLRENKRKQGGSLNGTPQA
jgi:hypothetical protein